MSGIELPEFPKNCLHARWFTDPVCSWSFAAEDAIESFLKHFSGRLVFENRMFVLYRDRGLPGDQTKESRNPVLPLTRVPP